MRPDDPIEDVEIDELTGRDLSPDDEERLPGVDSFDFRVEADRLVIVVAALANVDLAGIRASISTADALGPILDPTAYMKALHGGGMHEIERLADLAQPLVNEFLRLREQTLERLRETDL